MRPCFRCALPCACGRRTASNLAATDGQQQMLMQTGADLDPSSVQLDALSDSDGSGSDSDADADSVESIQDSFAGNRAIVLAGE